MDYQRIVDDLAQRINPEGAVMTLISNFPHRGYRGNRFEERLKEGVLNIGLVIQRVYSSNRADQFFREVSDYVNNTLPNIDNHSLLADAIVARPGESHSTASFMSGSRMQKALFEIGFMDKLDGVYVTLELITILTSRFGTSYFSEQSGRLRSGDLDGINQSLSESLSEYKQILKERMKKQEGITIKPKESDFEKWLAKQSVIGDEGYAVEKYRERRLIMKNLKNSYGVVLKLLHGIDFERLVV